MLEYFIKNMVFFGLTALSVLAFKLILGKSRLGKRPRGNAIRYPLTYKLAPLSFLAYFGVVTGLVAWQGFTDVVYVAASGVVAFGGLLLMLAWSLWHIEVGESELRYTNYFGLKRTYAYSELEVKKHGSGTKWYIFRGGKKIAKVTFVMSGYELLLEAYRLAGGTVTDFAP